MEHEITAPVIDEGTVSQLKELADGDAEFLDDLCQSFVSEWTQRIDELRTAVTEGQPDVLGKAAHRLKGGSANLGLARLSEICLKLELIGKGGITDGAAGYLDMLTGEYDHSMEEWRSRAFQ